MRGILLCAGPSLAHYDPQPAELVVAVNRAALTRQCDVWAAGDWPLVQEIRSRVAAFQIKTPLLFTASGGHAELRRPPSVDWGNPDGRDVVEFESLYDGHETDLQWTVFTATAALWYCFQRGVKRLDVFGADWGGGTYCDGSVISQNRRDVPDGFWNLERHHWEKLVKVCGERGMTVERHLLEAAR